MGLLGFNTDGVEKSRSRNPSGWTETKVQNSRVLPGVEEGVSSPAGNGHADDEQLTNLQGAEVAETWRHLG